MRLGYKIGIIVLSIGPAFCGFFAVSPIETLVTFLVVGLLAHILLRPLDWPRNLELLQSTAISLYTSRCLLLILTIVLPFLFGMAMAKFYGGPFRINSQIIDGEVNFTSTAISETSIHLSLSLGISLLGFLISRFSRTADDLYGSRSGLFGITDFLDRKLTQRHKYESRQGRSQTSPVTSPGTFVMIMPWVSSTTSSDAPQESLSCVDLIRDKHHALRMAHALHHAKQNKQDAIAAKALDRLLQGSWGEFIRSSETWK